ncbi:hypothetical protein BKI52_01965 [marine bacterium AO1-C]|nr:hypothetical protein BKI52_01965 [marine bacterium AO1-C]
MPVKGLNYPSFVNFFYILCIVKKKQVHIITQFFRKTLALTLAVLVLMGSTGVAIHKQTCLMMGEQTVALFHAHKPDCCDQSEVKMPSKMDDCEHMPATLKAKAKKCCALSVDLIKTEFKKTVSNDSGNSYQKYWTTVAKDQFHCFQAYHFLDSTPKYFFADSSPPLSGRNIITRKQSFLL